MGPRHTRVLLIDDDEDSFIITRDLCSRISEAVIQLEWADSFETGLEEIRNRRHDAYLIDYRLGAQDGIELLRAALSEGCRAPMIILTGQGEHAVDLQAMKEGAADFLIKKDLSAVVVERSIRYAIERAKTAEELLKHEAQLQLLTQRMSAILWTTDDQLQFTSSWGAGLRGLNLRPNQVVGQTLHEFFQTDDESDESIAAHRLALEGESSSYNTEWMGRKHLVHVNPLRNNGNRPVGVVGIALDITNARHLETEFNAARKIQQGLLPGQSPSLSGLDIAGVCRPAAATGGDYFDFVPLTDDAQGIVIADVSGHSFASALITMETRRLIRTLTRWNYNLAEVLSFTNMGLCEHPEDGRKFVTLFFAKLDSQSRKLTYSSAGHEGYLLRADGTMITLENHSLPLGIMNDAEFHLSDPMQLSAGDLLFLCTDGIDEAQSPDRPMFGKQKLFDMIEVHRNRPAAEIVDIVLKEVEEYCRPGTPLDDLTLIIVKVTAE